MEPHVRESGRRSTEQVPVTRMVTTVEHDVAGRTDRREWFETEVLELLPQLLGTARRLCRHGADAEDLVAEAVARAWTRLDTLADRASFRPWLCRILMNCYITECRARRARPVTESLDDQPGEDPEFSLFEQLHQPFLLWWGNTEREFLNRLLREDLEQAIDTLPEQFRVAVVLADVQGLAYQEIADVLDVPIGTIRSRLARGRALLQKALWEHAADAGIVKPRHSSRRSP